MSIFLLGLLCPTGPFITICSSWSKPVYKLRTRITFLPYRMLWIRPRIKKDESTYTVFILPHDASIPLNISWLGLQALQMISSFMYLFKWYTVVPVTVTPLLALPFCKPRGGRFYQQNRCQKADGKLCTAVLVGYAFSIPFLWALPPAHWAHPSV